MEKAKQQKVAVREVAQIEAKPLPLTSKVIVEREDYDKLVSAAQKYVVQEQKEGKLSTDYQSVENNGHNK